MQVQPRFVGAVALLISSVIAAPTRAHVTTAAAITFDVVEPDGSPVVRPVVMVSVFGPDYAWPYQMVGSAGGAVTIPFPLNDPTVRERTARGAASDLLIRVFDGVPGTGEVNSAYVAAAIGPDVTGAMAELSAVSGQTFTLQPGHTAYEVVPPGALVGLEATPPIGSDATPASVVDDDVDCPPPSPDGKPRACRATDYPTWAAHVLVPVAANHGAGNDMVSSMRYNSTTVTTTSVAFEAGDTGFLATEGTTAFTDERSITLGFADRGPNSNRKAYLDSEYIRQRAGSCFTGTDGQWRCQVETTYRPRSVGGTYSADSWARHDQLNTDYDCWVGVDGYFEPAEKSTFETTFGFRLGPDENWSQAQQGVMFANTKITQQTHTKKGFVRSWRVVSAPTYRYHYMVAPFFAAVAGFVGGPVGGECVRENLGYAVTYASNRDLYATDEVPATPPPPAATPDPNDPEPHTVCGRMPDRCD